MNHSFLERLRLLESPEYYQKFQGIKRGFECETLRVDNNGNLAGTPHPIALGSSLMHPRITTDFAEAQLEFITPPFDDIDAPLKNLTELYHFTQSVLQDELLWPGSMPCQLPREADISIAEFGSSNLGQLKKTYRKGLGNRYGRTMQTISGAHYNFSLPIHFWQEYKNLENSTLPLPLFVSEQYLGMVRNSLRFAWMLPLLFGASPAVSTSFFQKGAPHLQAWGKETLVGSYATSLRLSDLGYNNKVQSEMTISFDSLLGFLSSMRKIVHTRHPAYSEIGIKVGEEYQQLSDGIFQIEDEFYSLIRPKRVSGLEERMLTAMLSEGIEYIEVRALDLNPFEPIGIDPKMIYLLDVFLIFCLLRESPPLDAKEDREARQNVRSVVLFGRKPSVELVDQQGKSRELYDWAGELFDNFEGVASLLDKSYGRSIFSEACVMAKRQLQNREGLLSARILQEMHENKESYLDFGLRWGKTHQDYFRSLALPPSLIETYNKMSQESFEAQIALEKSSFEPFDNYLQRYLQT